MQSLARQLSYHSTRDTLRRIWLENFPYIVVYREPGERLSCPSGRG